MEEHARQIKRRQEQDLDRATSLRLSRERQQAMDLTFNGFFNLKGILHIFLLL